MLLDFYAIILFRGILKFSQMIFSSCYLQINTFLSKVTKLLTTFKKVCIGDLFSS